MASRETSVLNWRVEVAGNKLSTKVYQRQSSLQKHVADPRSACLAIIAPGREIWPIFAPRDPESSHNLTDSTACSRTPAGDLLNGKKWLFP